MELLNLFTWEMNLIITPAVVFTLAILFFSLKAKRAGDVIVLLIFNAILMTTALHDVYHLNTHKIPYAWMSAHGYLAMVISVFVVLAMQQRNLMLKYQKQSVAFGKFVPKQFLQLLKKNRPEDIHLGVSCSREVSIMFSDIRDYAGMSERLLPSENLKLLNKYLHKMENIIHRHEGFIDKYIGDAIMAIFAKSELNEEYNHAQRSVDSAMEMLKTVAYFNRYDKQDTLPDIKVGVGINTDTAILGTVGGENRLDTTVIGDAVNISARLEELTKFFESPLLITEKTYNLLDNPENYYIRQVDSMNLKGRQGVTNLYEVICSDLGEAELNKIRTLDIFNQAQVAFQNEDYGLAFDLFSAVAKKSPDDAVTKIFLNRCRQENAKVG